VDATPCPPPVQHPNHVASTCDVLRRRFRGRTLEQTAPRRIPTEPIRWRASPSCLRPPPLVPGLFWFRARVILLPDGPTCPMQRLPGRGKVSPLAHREPPLLFSSCRFCPAVATGQVRKNRMSQKGLLGPRPHETRCPPDRPIGFVSPHRSLCSISHNSLSAKLLSPMAGQRKSASFRANLRCGGTAGLTRPPAATRTTIAERTVTPAEAGKRKEAKKRCSPAALGWGTPRHSRGRLCYIRFFPSGGLALFVLRPSLRPSGHDQTNRILY